MRDILVELQIERGDSDRSIHRPTSPPALHASIARCDRRERLTNSGRALQIRRRAMPGGAVVLLYSDVTERKAADTKMAQAWAQQSSPIAPNRIFSPI